MRGSVRFGGFAVLVGCVLSLLPAWAGSRPAGAQPNEKLAQPSPVPTANATITMPRDGSTTHRRSAVVELSASGVPRGASVFVDFGANNWRSESTVWDAARRAYRAEVLLELGHNEVMAKVDIEDCPDEEGACTPLQRARLKVSVTRIRAANYGHLDRATASTVSYRRSVHALCGDDYEAYGCRAQPWCVALTVHRVDCPVATWTYPSKIRQCGLVITVRVRQRRVYWGRYPCTGRMSPNPRRHVRPNVQPVGRRFRTGSYWAVAPNKYGLPRFDHRRDLFIP